MPFFSLFTPYRKENFKVLTPFLRKAQRKTLKTRPNSELGAPRKPPFFAHFDFNLAIKKCLCKKSLFTLYLFHRKDRRKKVKKPNNKCQKGQIRRVLPRLIVFYRKKNLIFTVFLLSLIFRLKNMPFY